MIIVALIVAFCGVLLAGAFAMLGFNVAEHAGYGHGIGFWSACWLALFARAALHVTTKSKAS